MAGPNVHSIIHVHPRPHNQASHSPTSTPPIQRTLSSRPVPSRIPLFHHSLVTQHLTLSTTLSTGIRMRAFCKGSPTRACVNIVFGQAGGFDIVCMYMYIGPEAPRTGVGVDLRMYPSPPHIAASRSPGVRDTHPISDHDDEACMPVKTSKKSLSSAPKLPSRPISARAENPEHHECSGGKGGGEGYLSPLCT